MSGLFLPPKIGMYHTTQKCHCNFFEVLNAVLSSKFTVSVSCISFKEKGQ